METTLETPLWNDVLQHAILLFLYIGVIFLAKWLKGLLASYTLDEQLTEKDNLAVSVSFVGYLVGVTAIFIGAMEGPSYGLYTDFILVGGYSIMGILLLNLTKIINGKTILYKFSIDKEMIEDHNAGTGVIEGACFVASGLVIAGSIHGEGGSPLTALAFFGIGQVALALFAQVYSWLTPYDFHNEIEKDNTAAGLGFAGGIISIGIIVFKAVSGHFYGWIENLTEVGLDILIVFIYLIFVRLIFDRFILLKSNLNTEISTDRNLGAGLLEMMVSICFSMVLYFLL